MVCNKKKGSGVVKKNIRKILSAVLVLSMVFSAMFFGDKISARADDNVYADFELNISSLDVKTYTENIEKDGFTVLAGNGTDASVTVDANKKTVNNVEYTKRLKTGGSGTPTQRSIKFTTQAGTVVSIIACSANSGESRPLGIATLVDGTFSDVAVLNFGGSVSEQKVKLPNAGTYYLYPKSNGINFYDISVKYQTEEEGSDTERVDDEVREPAPDFKAGDIYVSAKGSENASGTFEDPMDLLTAINTVKAGNTIWMFSGTYYVYDAYNKSIVIEENNSGTADAMKKISSINNKTVTIDFDGMAEDSSLRGIVLDGSYWHFYDIDIRNAGDNGMLLSGDNNIIELCQFYKNHDSGLQLSRYNVNYSTVDLWPSNNLILNCTAFDNKDDKTSENADGFAAKLTCGNGNVFDGCISYCNSDDGWDLFAKTETGAIGVVTIKNCVAFGNGKLTNGVGSANGDMNGFKLGGSGVGTPHVVENCLAFLNGATGFTDNNNPSGITLVNCTAALNGAYDAKSNFNCYRSSTDAVYKNLVSFAASSGSETDQFKGTIINSLYHYKSLKTNNAVYWVKQWLCENGAKTKYTGSENADYTVTAADFVNTVVPGYESSAFKEDYHTIFRNKDGSINLNGLFEIKEDSVLFEAGKDGRYLGCRFSSQADEPNPPQDRDGLVQGEDGGWHLYENNVINTAFTGLACNENGWFYLKNGTVDWSYNGVTNNENGWWKVTDGRVDFNYTGIANNENGWWRIENGKVNFGFTGIANNENGWWYLENGKVDFDFNGLKTNENGTWVIKNGKVDFEYNGAYNDNGVLYFIQDGKVKMKLNV